MTNCLIEILLIVALAGVAGALNGLREAYHKSNEIFEDAFGWDEDGWFGSNSWMLKYKDYPFDQRARFPFAKSALAWMTDFWHNSNAVLVTILVFIPFLGSYTIWCAVGARISYSFVSHHAYNWINRKAGDGTLQRMMDDVYPHDIF